MQLVDHPKAVLSPKLLSQGRFQRSVRNDALLNQQFTQSVSSTVHRVLLLQLQDMCELGRVKKPLANQNFA